MMPDYKHVATARLVQPAETHACSRSKCLLFSKITITTISATFLDSKMKSRSKNASRTMLLVAWRAGVSKYNFPY